MSAAQIDFVDVSRAIVHAEGAVLAELAAEKEHRQSWGARECEDIDRLVGERIARLEGALLFLNGLVAVDPRELARLVNEAAQKKGALAPS